MDSASSQTPGPTTPAPNAPAEHRIETSDGVALSVLTWNLQGTLTPVLLVHGLASNARLWDGVASFLAGAGHAVAAVDQRGHGRSAKPDGGYDWQTLTDDLIAVADHLGWERKFVAAGQSWGGNVVLELADRHPQRIAAAVLVDGGTIELSTRFADWPTCEVALSPPALAGTRLADVEAMIRARHSDWPESGIQGTLANLEALPDSTVRPWLSREHHLTILRGLWEHHPPKVFPRIQVPVMIVPAGDPARSAGRFDSGKRQEVEAAAAAIPTSALRWVAGDHDLHAQHPEVIAKLLEEAAQGEAFEAAKG